MPNTSDIWGQHRVMIGVVRILAIMGSWAGLIPTSVTIAVAIYEDRFAFYSVGPPLIVGLSLLLPGVALWVLAPWIARKALPNPLRTLCPSCGYELKDSIGDRCTECGLTLSEEFRTGAVLPGASRTPAARTFMRQGQMSGIARLLGALLILPCMALALGMLIAAAEANGDLEFWIFGLIGLVALLGMVFCVIPWFFPRLIGRMLVPTRLSVEDHGAEPPLESPKQGILPLREPQPADREEVGRFTKSS